MTLFFLGGLLVLILFGFIRIYRICTEMKNHCERTWAKIETMLEHRYHLISSLLTLAGDHADYERCLLSKIIDLKEACRNERRPTRRKAKMETELTRIMTRLITRMKAYPELKENQRFLSLDTELTDMENRLRGALRAYNGNVRENNAKLALFPSSSVAALFGIGKRGYFEIKGHFRVPPKFTC